MSYSKISIIVTGNANPEGYVRLLTSCERLHRDELELEIILMLQGLSQKVEDLIKSYAFALELKFVSMEAGQSRAVVRTAGVKEASHEIVLFLDADLEVSPDLLYGHLEHYDEASTLAVMGEVFLPRFIKKSRWLRFLDGNYRSTRRWATEHETRNSPPLRYVNTANFSIRKTSFLACGESKEVFDCHEAENIDLAFRIKKLDAGIIKYEPEAIAFCLHPPLRKSLEQKYRFGKHDIPKLLKAYPELYPRLPSRFVRLDGFTTVRPLYRYFMQVLFSVPVFLFARGVRVLGPEFIAYRMMRYMLQYESVRGFRASVRSQKARESAIH